MRSVVKLSDHSFTEGTSPFIIGALLRGQASLEMKVVQTPLNGKIFVNSGISKMLQILKNVFVLMF